MAITVPPSPSDTTSDSPKHLEHLAADQKPLAAGLHHQHRDSLGSNSGSDSVDLEWTTFDESQTVITNPAPTCGTQPTAPRANLPTTNLDRNKSKSVMNIDSIIEF